jgi:hypothetical protein
MREQELVDSFLGLIFLFGSCVYISRYLRNAFKAAPVPESENVSPSWQGPSGLKNPN